MNAPRYVPWMPIARGGMAEIWLGVLQGAAGYQKPVVMKRALAEGTVTAERAEEVLVAESRVCAGLNHPNIVHSYALVEVDGVIYLVMEYVPGLSLRAVSNAMQEKKDCVPLGVALRVIADAARALEHAHETVGVTGDREPVVHGDVSPDNLIVGENGVTKLLDFGCARESGSSPSEFGKAAYASPEIIGRSPAAAASDVFSLGVVAHELLTGKPLFARPSITATLTAVTTAPIPELGSTISQALRDVVRRALVREAVHRNLRAGEVAGAFEAAANELGAGPTDVAIFLRSEFAPVLQARRLKLRAVLNQPATGIKPSRLTTSSTSVAVEALFEAVTIPDGEARGVSLSDDADTIVDPRNSWNP